MPIPKSMRNRNKKKKASKLNLTAWIQLLIQKNNRDRRELP